MLSITLMIAAIALFLGTTKCFIEEPSDCHALLDAESCLRAQPDLNCGWCSTSHRCLFGDSLSPLESEFRPSDANDDLCRPQTAANGTKVSSPFWEYHDLIYSGSIVCSTLNPENQNDISNREKCVAPLNRATCSWSNGNRLTNKPICAYRYNNELSVATASPDNIPDILLPCSSFKTCSSCAENGRGLCSWCPSRSQCMSNLPETGYDDLYTKEKIRELCPPLNTAETDIDDNGDTGFENGFDNSCCDEYGLENGVPSCSSCTLHYGAIGARQCLWSFKDNKCVKAPVSDNLTFDAIEEVCPHCNYFGNSVCRDKCYSNGYNCNTCTSTTGCVWIEELEYIKGATNISEPEQKKFCLPGSFYGPRSTVINAHPDVKFEPKKFYFLSCGMEAGTLLGLIIGLCVAAVVIAIAVFVGVKAGKRAKYARLIKQARLVSQQIGESEENNADNFNADFVLTYETVPWEDEPIEALNVNFVPPSRGCRKTPVIAQPEAEVKHY